MTGKSHIATSVVTAGIVAETLFVMEQQPVNTVCYSISEHAKNFLLDNGAISFPVFIGISIILYLLGAILPDIDHPYSMIGKIVHLPIEHRTWTHAVWIPAMLCIAGIFWRPLFFLGVGMLSHDFWDSPSESGISPFYPKKNKHHVVKLYKVGHFSEYLLVTLVILLFLVYTFFCLVSVYHFVNISF